MTNQSGIDERVASQSPVHVAQEVLLVFVIAASIMLNFSVVYVICSNKNLRKITTNIFILNLVISNALMAIFVMPLSLATFIKLGWSVDSLHCKVSGKYFTNFSLFFAYGLYYQETLQSRKTYIEIGS